MNEVFKEYEGKVLRLKYPGLLKIKTEEPWWALARGKKASVMIEINPIKSRTEAFARMIRDPFFSKTPGAFIERGGDFTTNNGIIGYERVSRMSETMAWAVDGRYLEKDLILIQIWTTHSEWHDGRIWRDLIDSIKVVRT